MLKQTIALGAVALIQLLATGLPAFAAKVHPCAQKPDLRQITQCFETLPMQERIRGFRNSMSAVTRKFSDGVFDMSIRLYDEPTVPFSRQDAVAVYRQIRGIFETAQQEAQAQNKQLVFLAGEGHPFRTDLMLGTMLLKIAKRHGTERFGFETAKESLVAGGVHYKGLLELVGHTYDHLGQTPSESEPIDENFLGGARHNQAFEIWELMRSTTLVPRDALCTDANCWHSTEGKVSDDTFIFSADPMFWNWAKYPALFGYLNSREPGMAITLVEQSLLAKPGAPVVAVYGYLHLKGIAERLRQTGREDSVLLRTLAFGQTLNLYNPKMREDLDELNDRERHWIDNNLLRRGGNILLVGKKGPSTAAEALALANYADSVAGN